MCLATLVILTCVKLLMYALTALTGSHNIFLHLAVYGAIDRFSKIIILFLPELDSRQNYLQIDAFCAKHQIIIQFFMISVIKLRYYVWWHISTYVIYFN